MYKARHYVRVNGKMYRDGETIPEELSAEKAAWLMGVGAIEIASTVMAADQITEPEEMPEQMQADVPERPMDYVEEEEEAEVPEIDVMAGIVAETLEEEPKKTARKNSRKTTERRKSK